MPITGKGVCALPNDDAGLSPIRSAITDLHTRCRLEAAGFAQRVDRGAS